MTMWREKREAAEKTLSELQTKLHESGNLVRAGDDYDNWDLEVWAGMFGGGRLLMGTEEHAPGKQLLRFRITPTHSSLHLAVMFVFAAMSITGAFSEAWLASALSASVAALIAGRVVTDAGRSCGQLRNLLELYGASR